MKTPAAEIGLSLIQVRELLERQAPAFVHLPVRYLAEGWDNVIYRLGEKYLLRIPRRQLGADLLKQEQKWLPVLGKGLPIDVPIPLFSGQPEEWFPWPWSITPWFLGNTAAETLPVPSEAMRLAEFYRTLHQPAPPNAPENSSRGVSLSAKSTLTNQRLERLVKEQLVPVGIYELWEKALAAAAFEGPARWLHGDSHPKNILVYQGKLSAIIDWGDVTSGDVATDLAAFWMLFGDQKTRRKALQQYGVDEATFLRAQGWAVFFSAILLEVGIHTPDPLFEQVGRFTLANLLQEMA